MGKEIYVVDIESDCTDKISDDLEKVNRHIDKLGRSIDRLREQLKRFDRTQFRMEIDLRDQSVNSFMKITCKEDGIFRLSINLDTEIEGLNIDLPLEDVIKSITELKESLSNLPSHLTAANWKDDSVPTKFNGLKRYARGGFLNSPHIGIVGEEGPEAIIPLSASRRERGKQLWYETGMRLGTLQGMSSGNYNEETGYVDLKRTSFGNLSVINSVAKYANGTIYAGNDISNNSYVKIEDYENSEKKSETNLKNIIKEIGPQELVIDFIEKNFSDIPGLLELAHLYKNIGNYLSILEIFISYAMTEDRLKDRTLLSGIGSFGGGIVGGLMGTAGAIVGSYLGKTAAEFAYDIFTGEKLNQHNLKYMEETNQYIDSINEKAEIHLEKRNPDKNEHSINNFDFIDTVKKNQGVISKGLNLVPDASEKYNKYNQMINVEYIASIIPAMDTYLKLMDIERTALAEFEGKLTPYINSNALKYVEKIKETLRDYGKDAPDDIKRKDMFNNYKIFFEKMYSDIEEDEPFGGKSFRQSIVENPKKGFRDIINPIRSKISEDIGPSITGLQNSSLIKTYIEKLVNTIELDYELRTGIPLKKAWEKLDIEYKKGSISNIFGDLSYDKLLDDGEKETYVNAFIVSFLRNKFGLDKIKDEDGNKIYWSVWDDYFFGNVLSDSDKLKNLPNMYESTYIKPDLDVKAHANGGIFTSTHMGIVAESGPEAVIPLSGVNKHRGVELWYQTGKALGFGLTDIASPYNYDNVRERDSLNKAMPQRYSVENSGGNGGKQSKSNVEINIGGIGGMNFTINTSGSDNVIQDIREEIPEVANELADTIANALARAYSNMPLN